MGDAAGRDPDPGGNASRRDGPATGDADVEGRQTGVGEQRSDAAEGRASDGGGADGQMKAGDEKRRSGGEENGTVKSNDSKRTNAQSVTDGAQVPEKSQKPKEFPKAADGVVNSDESKKPGDLPKSDESKKPDDTKKPDESKKPDDTKKPDESKKSDDTMKPDESKRPGDLSKSDESKKPDDVKKSDGVMKPSETKKSDQLVKPEEQKPPSGKEKSQKKPDDKTKSKAVVKDDQPNKTEAPKQIQEVSAKSDERNNDDQTLQEPPVAPPRRSPARRKRLLGKRIRKRTGGETGDGIRKLDPTTSEEEADADRPNERKVDQWRREDEEKRKKDEKREKEKVERDELEQHEIEEWTRRFQEAKRKLTEPDEPVKRDADAKDAPKEEAVVEVKEEVIPRWKFWKRAPKKKEVKEKTPKEETKDVSTKTEEQEGRTTVRLFSREARLEYARFKRDNWHEWERIKRLWNKCMGEIFLVVMLCGAGAFVFRFTEGAFENFYKCGVKRVKRDFVDELWRGSTYLKEEEWKSRARRKLMEMEQQLEAAFDAGVSSYSGHKSWSFINSLVYSLTVISTIGYGHIAPSTTTGKALTIVYAIIGIPLFLILLADFGKLFTRGIKWVWAFVRRLYYTGSCKKVRKTARVQEVMKGVQLVYDIAAFRKQSGAQVDGVNDQQLQSRTPASEADTMPSTPAPSNFVIDEEFNLPITLAIFILVLYMFCGAVVFWMWEDWSFFDSFYFVFISMSTIGFGDLVPKNKMYMMASIVYLAFGLALTSMCINVVQEKLSDTFRQASTKIGATIGLKMKGPAGEELDLSPTTPAPMEMAMVHQSTRGSAAPTTPAAV